MSAVDDADGRVDTGRRNLLEHATAGVGGLALAGASYPFFVSLYPSERARAQGARLRSTSQRSPPALSARLNGAAGLYGLCVGLAKCLHAWTPRATLSDPASSVAWQQPGYASNPTRSIRPDVFVAVGLCTHLGCIPSFRPKPGSLKPGWPGRLLLPLSRIEIRPSRARLQWLAGADESCRSPLQLMSETNIVVGRDGEGEAK